MDIFHVHVDVSRSHVIVGFKENKHTHTEIQAYINSLNVAHLQRVLVLNHQSHDCLLES